MTFFVFSPAPPVIINLSTFTLYMVIKYELKKKSNECNARLGRITTPHGSFDTPVFMAVGTQGTVKTLVKEETHNKIKQKLKK